MSGEEYTSGGPRLFPSEFYTSRNGNVPLLSIDTSSPTESRLCRSDSICLDTIQCKLEFAGFSRGKGGVQILELKKPPLREFDRC